MHRTSRGAGQQGKFIRIGAFFRLHWFASGVMNDAMATQNGVNQMARKSRLPDLPPVDSFEVAPHRYLWNMTIDYSIDLTSMKAVREAAPYKDGEVVYVVYGESFARAYILQTWCSRDRYGDLREAYEVRRETKSGHWANRTYTVHPGHIQRGYYRAGIALDIPKGIF